jgi:uncharacterized repeat protein (TIGR01451 family)
MTKTARTTGAVSARLMFAVSALVAMSLALPATALATRTIGLSSPTFEFNVVPGQSGKGELYVIDDGTEPLKVMVYAANQTIDASGTIKYEVPKFGDLSNQGPASWFRIQMPQDSKSFGNTPYLEMQPGQRTLVKFSFEVPADAPAGDHQTVLFFEMFDFPKGGGMLSPVTGRVGSRIRVRVQGTLVEKVDVQPFGVREFVIGDQMPYTFVVRNDGNVDKSVTAKIDMLDSSENSIVSSSVMTETTVYAHSMSERSGTMSLAGLGIGKFTARLTLTYPSEADSRGQTVPHDVTKDRTVWVIPLWVVIVVAVLLVGLLLWLLWRGAVKAAERRAARPSKRAARHAKREAAKAAASATDGGADEVYERPPFDHEA